jgi:hypothetical protein
LHEHGGLLTIVQLDAILTIMDIKAKRQDGEGAPVKADKVRALADKTVAAVQEKCNALRGQMA